MSLTLILGGARSGKSGFAQRLALEHSESPIYVATSRAWDDDHRARIARHQSDRGPEWTTLEAERQLGSIVATGRVLVVDCVTLWLTNFFVDEKQDVERVLELARQELELALSQEATWIFVSNELGLAPHALSESGRKFVDLQGFFNQELARRADPCPSKRAHHHPKELSTCTRRSHPKAT
jgi:adenosylcobinamide kinase/adenosylcobinamide-phosphate guanylyltransferase